MEILVRDDQQSFDSTKQLQQYQINRVCIYDAHLFDNEQQQRKKKNFGS